MIGRVYLLGIGFVLLDFLTTLLREPPEEDRYTWIAAWYYDRSPYARGLVKGILIAMAAIFTENWLQTVVEPTLASESAVNIGVTAVIIIIGAGIGWSMGGAMLFSDKAVFENE